MCAPPVAALAAEGIVPSEGHAAPGALARNQRTPTDWQWIPWVPEGRQRLRRKVFLRRSRECTVLVRMC